MMSVSAIVETFDAQMSDFNEDADMALGGPLHPSENWFSQLPSTHSRMEEDSNIADASDTQEIDMTNEAFDETVEYEMEEDPGPQFATSHGDEVIDAEVFDAIQTSPIPPVSSGVMMMDPVHDSNHGQPSTDHFTPTEEIPPIEQQQHNAEGATTFPSFVHRESSVAPVTSDAQDSSPQARSSEPAPQTHDPVHDVEQASLEAPITVPVISSSEATIEHTNSDARVQQTNQPEVPFSVAEIAETSHSVDSSALVQTHTDSAAGANCHEGFEIDNDADINRTSTLVQSLQSETDDVHRDRQVHSSDLVTEPHEVITEQTGMPLPPPIFLSLRVTTDEGEQPEFVLFSPVHDMKKPEGTANSEEEPLVLLQHHPNLFYEPISSVFEVFRQEEYFTHIEELAESEMVLSAEELQLSISEDNIYAREVSLQDLFAMHQGVGLLGTLKLTLESVVPRFIIRYNVLRDRITRLTLGEETGGQEQNATSPDPNGSGPQLQNAEHDGQEDAQQEGATVSDGVYGDEFGTENDEDQQDDEGDEREEHDQLQEPAEAVAINDSEGQQPLEETHEDQSLLGQTEEDAEGEIDDFAEDTADAREDEDPYETSAEAVVQEYDADHRKSVENEDPVNVDLADKQESEDVESDGAAKLTHAQEEQDPGESAETTNISYQQEEPNPSREHSEAEGEDTEAGDEPTDPSATNVAPDDDDFGSDDDEFEYPDSATQAEEPSPVNLEVQAEPVITTQLAQAVSLSKSTSSLNTDDLVWSEQPGEGNDDLQNDLQQPKAVYDEQGNTKSVNSDEQAEFDDDEDNFDDFNFEDSTEDTLEDTNEDLSATLNANDLVKPDHDKVDGRDSNAEEALLTPSAEELDNVLPDEKDSEATTHINERLKETVQKNVTKRRSDDAELDIEELSSPDSPGMKRSRVI